VLAEVKGEVDAQQERPRPGDSGPEPAASSPTQAAHESGMSRS
jgi:hypothetical protein